MTARPVFQKRPAIARSASRVTKASATARKSPFLADMLSGLSKTPKRTPPKYFYDEKGSELFEQITRLPEYYPTRKRWGSYQITPEIWLIFAGRNVCWWNRAPGI